MRPRVTAVVVAHEAAAILATTLEGLGRQSVAPHRTVMVHIDSKDATRDLMRATAPDLLVTVDSGASFGQAVAEAVDELAAADGDGDADQHEDNEWLWLLAADNVPEFDALEKLLDTAERNPSLEVTGPKLVRPDDPAMIVSYGESITRTGTAVPLHEGALDQGQFEGLSDVLAVAAGGMLVRRSTWERLAGFDPGLPAVDDALDFCIRTWLSDGRVLLTPDARVESRGDDAPGTEYWGRRTGRLARYRIRRTAELHRNLSSATAIGFVVTSVLMLPAAVVLTVLHLLRKQPGRILPEWRACLTVLFGGTGAWRSRRRFAETSAQPISSLDRLFISRADWRRMQAHRRDEYRALLQHGRDRYNFVTGGGIWLVLASLLVSIVIMFPLLRGGVISGGALLPLSGSLGELWGHTGYGLRDTGGGIGVADPFSFLLAVLGTLTFWQPSLILLVIWVLALPISTLGGWYLAARVTRSGWLRGFAALAWTASPMLFVALSEGRLAAVVVHLALPWLIFTGFIASRSWAGAATCSLLAVAISACAPSLIPALLVIWVISVVLAGRGAVRQLFVPIPTVAMFLPLLVTQINRGRPLAVLADPGLPTDASAAHGWLLALGYPETGLGGWPDVLSAVGLTDVDPVLVVACFAIPFGVLAVIGLVTRGWRLALAGVVTAVLGFTTAAICGGLALTVTGGEAVHVWIGPALSLAWMGVLAAALAGAAGIGPVRVPLTSIAALGLLLLIVPVAPAQLTGTSPVTAGDGRTLPALVDAQGRAAEQLGTLVISPVGNDSLQVHLERGTGLKLDELSTLRTTNPDLIESDRELAEIAVGFLSPGTTNPTPVLHELGIGFVLVQPAAEQGDTALGQRLNVALSSNEALQTAGDTGSFGVLYQVVGAAEQPTDPILAQALSTDNLQNVLGRLMLLVQAAVLIFVALLALPTGGLASRARSARLGALRWPDLDPPEPARFAGYGNVGDETIDVYAEEPDYLDKAEGATHD